MLDGLAAGERHHGTIVRVTPDVVRDLGIEAAERTLEVARKFADDGVVGLKCAGGERTEIAPVGAGLPRREGRGAAFRAARG
ncbi:MAG: hypothetical protein ABWZ53_13875 [Actinomycetota bacterium]